MIKKTGSTISRSREISSRRSKFANMAQARTNTYNIIGNRRVNLGNEGDKFERGLSSEILNRSGQICPFCKQSFENLKKRIKAAWVDYDKPGYRLDDFERLDDLETIRAQMDEINNEYDIEVRI